MKLKMIALAAMMAAGSASAAIDTGATGNGELFFNIWWTGAGSQSYTRDLNTSIDAFDADLTNGMNLAFTSDANLDTFMNGAAGKTLFWNVVATDNAGDYRVLTTFGYVNSSNLNGYALPATGFKTDDTSRLTGNKVEIFALSVNSVLAGNDSVIRNTGTTGYSGVDASFGKKIGNTTTFLNHGVLANDSEANGLKMMRIDALGTSTDDTHYVELGTASDNLNVWFDANKTLNFAAAAPVPEADTYAFMALGMGLVGFLARRRKAV